MKKFIWRILELLHISDIFILRYYSYLKVIGWYKSYYSRSAVDANNQPIPWCTYPFIYFIGPRIKKSFSVFEFGAGNSTHWYSNKAGKVISVEHDKEWYEKIKNRMPSNAEIHFEELIRGGNYSKFANVTGEKFDIIVVDGRDRVNCAKNALESLKPEGVLIIDNSNLDCYSEAIVYLKEKGYSSLDFWGISPIMAHNCCTSIYYKANNCLGI